MCIADVFAQPVACLSILLTVFHRAKVFHFNEVQYQFFLSLIVLLVLYVKSDCHTQHHLDFLLCFLLGIL